MTIKMDVNYPEVAPQPISAMCLAVVSRSVFVRRSIQLFTKEADGLYLDRIAPVFRSMIICACVIDEQDVHNYQGVSGYSYTIRSGNVYLCQMPSLSGALPTKIINSFLALLRLYRALRNVDVLLLFFPSYYSAMATILNRVFLGKKSIVYLGSQWREVSTLVGAKSTTKNSLLLLKASINDFLERKSVEWADACLVTGDALLEKYRHVAQRIEKTYPLLTLQVTQTYTRDDTCYRYPIKCLIVASLTPRKGIEYAIRAMAVLQKKGLDIRLDLVGGGDPEPLSTLASELGISKIVNFRGYLTGESLLSAYREADIFILPSLAEGFPRVIYEAMSQGLPVIATNLPSISSVIENGVSGLLVPPRNPDLLARAIERLVIDAGLRRQLIVNGQELIRSVLSHDASRQFVDLVRLII